MSEGELRQLWCLLHSNDLKERAFSVDVRLSWNMDQLAEAIQGKKFVLRDLETSDILLWKVNELVQVSPLDSFHKRLPISLRDSCSALDDPAWKVSEYFPKDLVADPLHIIVSQRVSKSAGSSPPPFKKRRVGPALLANQSKKSLESFREFRNYYWGENRIQLLNEGGKILDLTPTNANLVELNYRSISTLVIRDEYDFAYDAIVKAIVKSEPGKRVVFIFTGQPGIGKTLFLFVLLVLGLQHKQNVALQINSHHFVLFSEDGVTKHGEDDNFEIPGGTWTLSPASGSWMGWAEQFGAIEYVMDIWSLAEFQALLAVSEMDIPTGKTLFLRYGSNIGCIMDILKHRETEIAYDQDVKRGAAEIAQGFSMIFPQLESLDFKSKLSSKIFTVRPNNLVDRLGVLTIPTAYLFKTLAIAVSSQVMAQQHYIFVILTAHPSLCTAAGWWFKNYAHHKLSDPTRLRIPTRIRGDSNSSPIPIPKVMLSGTAALRNIQRPFNFYWRPREPNFQGIDSLIRVGSEVRVQQYTTSSSHGSATEGLNEIYKIMNHVRGVDWHLDIVGPDMSIAETARNSHKLTGRWAKTPIHSSELQLGILDKQMLEQVLNKTSDDSYPEYRMCSLSVHVPSCSTMGDEKKSSTGAPHHQATRVSTRRKNSSQKRSKTLSAPPTARAAPRRSLRNQK